MYSGDEKSFLSELLKKQAYVMNVAETTGKKVSGPSQEVTRQIKQALRGGDPMRGEGVTKSGEED